MCSSALSFRFGCHKTSMHQSVKKEQHTRYTHRASTNEFLLHWKKDNPNFVQSAKERWPKMFQVSLPKDILRLEAAMKLKNMTPCIHFQQPIWKVAVECATAMAGFYNEKFFKRLRAISKEYEKSCEQVLQEMLSLFAQGKRDNFPGVKKHLLSVSYTLIGNLMNQESAASWGFKDSYEDSAKLQEGKKEAQKMVAQSMIYSGFSTKAIAKVMHAVEPFLHKYAALSTGDFYVIGIPNALAEKVTYDSEAWGNPTNYSVLEMSRHISKHPMALDGGGEDFINRGGPQLRVILGKETLCPKFGVKVISANNTELVDEFCQGLELTPAEKVETYQKFFRLEETPHEKEEKEKRKVLDEEFHKIIREISTLAEDVRRIREKASSL